MNDVTIGSGNVFADLGFENADELLARAKLTLHICRIIKGRGWKPKAAAEALGLPLPEVTALVKGRFNDYSIERLLGLLTRLDQNVTIQVKAKTKRQAHGKIQVIGLAA